MKWLHGKCKTWRDRWNLRLRLSRALRGYQDITQTYVTMLPIISLPRQTTINEQFPSLQKTEAIKFLRRFLRKTFNWHDCYQRACLHLYRLLWKGCLFVHQYWSSRKHLGNCFRWSFCRGRWKIDFCQKRKSLQLSLLRYGWVICFRKAKARKASKSYFFGASFSAGQRDAVIKRVFFSETQSAFLSSLLVSPENSHILPIYGEP